MTKFWFVLIVISLFFTLPISTPLWQILPLPKVIQFPWRFLAVTAFALAALASRWPKKIGLIIAVLAVATALPFLSVERTFHPESFYTTNDDTTTVQNEYLPKGVKVAPTQRPEKPKTVYFPGVKVIVNGQEFEPEVDANGIVATPGKIVFRETPLRLFADLVSLFTLLVCAAFLIRKLLLHFSRT